MEEYYMEKEIVEIINEQIYQQIKKEMCKTNDYFSETEFLDLYSILDS